MASTAEHMPLDMVSQISSSLNQAHENIRVKLDDPAGYADDVAANVNIKEEMDGIVSALDAACTRATAAAAFAAQGNIKAAFGRWQSVFGEYFPSYG